jgi:phenylacetate-CoA ligase
MFLEGQNYVVINMFLPSAWFLGLMRGLGPNVAEAYETLKDLGTQPKYLIMGHTSLIEFFVKSSPFDLAPFDITLLIGGEHMSRALHATFLEKGIKRVYSGYGASDIHFTVGIQEEFIQELQRLCWSNPTLQAELTGKLNGHPYFFQYSPLHDYIEEIDGHLIFTDLDHTRLSPRIRYDLGDRGKVLKMSFVQKVLQKHGISLEPRANLPLICLYGREEHTVMYNTIELAFDDLELAILNTPELGSVMNRYAYNVYEQQEGNKTLEFWVELKDGVSAEQFDAQDLEQKILSALAEVNFVFKQETNNGANASIPLKIYAYGTSPMLPESIMRKAKFVYNVQP